METAEGVTWAFPTFPPYFFQFQQWCGWKINCFQSENCDVNAKLYTN